MEYCILDSFFSLHILEGRGEHELDAVQLVDFGSTGVVVDGHEIGVGVVCTDLLQYALSDDVVGQAAEGLDADDVLGPGPDQFHHFPDQEPALAGLVADRDNGLGQVRQFFNVVGRGEAVGL